MPISPGSCAPPLQWAGSEGWGLAVLHLSVTGPPLQLYFTFRVVQTVGVNAAEASDTVKFPRFTFGCVPRRQEERKEGTKEDKREGRSAGQRPHLDRAEKKTEKDRKRAEKRDRCKNNSSFQGLLIEEGRGLVCKWEEPMSTMKMKLSLQHNSAKTSSIIKAIHACVPAFISIRRSRCSFDFCERACAARSATSDLCSFQCCALPSETRTSLEYFLPRSYREHLHRMKPGRGCERDGGLQMLPCMFPSSTPPTSR